VTFEKTSGGRGIVSFFKPQQTVAYAALPENINTIDATIGVGDVRVGKVLEFLDNHHSPLTTYASELVETADKYSIDYRWLPAIAMQESGGCARVIGDSMNCWGYGIHGGRVKKFDSYSQGIDTVGQYLAKKKENGLDTIDKLGDLYNPSNHNDWKGKVTLFLSQMD